MQALSIPGSLSIQQIKSNIFCGDALTILYKFPAECIDTIITSPPFFRQRLYNVPDEIGREETVQAYVEKLVVLFDECRRVLKPTGSIWVELGDKLNTDAKYRNGLLGNVSDKTVKGNQYNGTGGKIARNIPKKSFLMVPERFAIAMSDAGWCVRNKVINFTPNAMPDSAGDRFGIDYTNFYWFIKNESKYYFDPQYEPIAEDTLRESKYTVDLANRKDQTTRQCLNKWGPSKIKFGGNKANGYNKATYSGNTWDIESSNAVKLTNVDRANAIKMGWDGVSSYADWYFSERQKRSWHDHSNDEKGGYGQQSRGQKPPQIPYPYGRIKRSVWRIAHGSSKENHFAAFSEKLVITPLLATCPKNGIVLDCFSGTGTTCVTAIKHDRNYVGIDASSEYCEMARARLKETLMKKVMGML